MRSIEPNPADDCGSSIGGRVKVDVWYDRLELIKSKPIGNGCQREKMPFEVTPFMPYSAFHADTPKPANASSAETKPPETALPATDPKPADSYKAVNSI